MTTLLSNLPAFIVGVVLGAGLCEALWRQDAVRRGFAHYNRGTGKWQLNKEPAP